MDLSSSSATSLYHFTLTKAEYDSLLEGKPIEKHTEDNKGRGKFTLAFERKPGNPTVANTTLGRPRLGS